MRIDVEKLTRELAEKFYDDDIWDGMPSIVQGNWSHVAKKASALVLEEAAKVCDEKKKTVSPEEIIGYERRDAGINTCVNIAAAIRALAKGGE